MPAMHHTRISRYAMEVFLRQETLSQWRKADKSAALNVDLWEQLLPLLERHAVTFCWVKGHAGHPFNERCDALATAYADSFQKI